MSPNEDVRDLSGGDCDVPNSDKCVCLLSPTSDNYWVELGPNEDVRVLSGEIVMPQITISVCLLSPTSRTLGI